MKKDICAVIASFNPARSLIDNVAAVLPQVDSVVVVDDGSGEGCEEILKLVEESGAVVLRQGANLGLACALNRGARYALARKYQWIATFDQDSGAPAGLIDEMLSAYESCLMKSSVGILSPFHYDPSRGKISGMKKGYEKLPYAQAEAVITSGCLIKKEVFAAAGYFEEKLFIDYVDFEFCLRARSKGYLIIQAPKAVLRHRFGDISQRGLFGMNFYPTNHGFVRKYYNARNRFIVYKKNIFIYPSWVIGGLYKFMKMLAKTAILRKTLSAP